MVKDQLIHRYLRVPYLLHIAKNRNLKGNPTIVLIHGIGSTSIMWKQVETKITQKARVISVDLLGFGKSPKPIWSKYNARQHAATLARTLRNLKASRDIIIVGHSLGALVAVEYASRHKKSVKRLILCSPPFYKPPVQNPARIIIKDDAYRKLYKYIRNNHQSVLKISNLFQQYFKLYKHILLNADTLPAYIKSLEASIENQDSFEKIKKLNIPIDVMYGKFDLLLVKRNLKQIQKANHQVKLYSIAAGHEIAGLFPYKLTHLINSYAS